MLHYFYLLYHYLANHLWPSVCWTLLILSLCLMPASGVPSTPVIPGLDKVVHAFLFAAWAFLSIGYKPEKRVSILVFGVIMGAGIEVLQEVTAIGRSFEWWDIAADCVGLVAGYLLHTGVAQGLKTRT